MKLVVFAIFVMFLVLFLKQGNDVKALPNAPKTISIYNEILVQYPQNLAPLWNGLKAEERVFIYYLWRAALPGNRILIDQIHRHGLEMRDIFRSIYTLRIKNVF